MCALCFDRSPDVQRLYAFNVHVFKKIHPLLFERSQLAEIERQKKNWQGLAEDCDRLKDVAKGFCKERYGAVYEIPEFK